MNSEDVKRRGLLSPIWLLGHLLALLAVGSFPLLGLWQLDRHEEQSQRQAALDQRPQMPPVDAADLAAGDVGELPYRRAELTGRYAVGDEVLLANRPHEGQPGHHLLTPLETTEGDVLVDRGWVPMEGVEGPAQPESTPPEGEVTVTGLLLPAERARRAGVLGEGVPAEEAVEAAAARASPVEFVTGADPRVVAAATGRELPALVLLADDGHRRAGADLPATVPPPDPDAGTNHLSYAVQWFLFTGVVAVGYPTLLVRRRAGDS